MDGELPPTPADLAPESEATTASMRQLWSDQVVFTRRYVIAAVAGMPVSEALTNLLGRVVAPIATAPGVRQVVPKLSEGDAAAVGLLSTMEAIGESIVPYFGTQAGDELTSLLRRLVLIAVELLGAARSGDISEFVTQDERLIANTEEIAAFLSSVNDKWDRGILSQNLQRLIQLTKDEAVARVAGNYEVDRRTFDAIHDQAMAIADYLDQGLTQKVPETQPAT